MPHFFHSKSTRLMTTDLKATNYVLFNSYDYPKSEVFFVDSLPVEMVRFAVYIGEYLDDVTLLYM